MFDATAHAWQGHQHTYVDTRKNVPCSGVMTTTHINDFIGFVQGLDSLTRLIGFSDSESEVVGVGVDGARWFGSGCSAGVAAV